MMFVSTREDKVVGLDPDVLWRKIYFLVRVAFGQQICEDVCLVVSMSHHIGDGFAAIFAGFIARVENPLQCFDGDVPRDSMEPGQLIAECCADRGYVEGFDVVVFLLFISQ